MARARRPLGCRLFFCAPDLADWSARAYETFHRQVRRLHAVRALPYAYRELTAALGELTHPACPDAAPDPGELPMLFSVDRGGRGD